MASCLVPEFPAVMVALEHLKELDQELKEEGALFGPEACLHLTEITAALTELEKNRRAVHEYLEVETIENSKLRHQISNMSDQMRYEIVADVAAARASNAEEIEQLHKDLSAISQQLEATVKRQNVVLSQNEALHSERDQMKSKHEQLIAVLNDRITLKYSLQIKLEKTREQIEELKSSIAAAEQDKITLEQNIALEKEAFSVKKDSLSGEVDQTEEKIQQQKQVIKTRRKELKVVNDQKKEKQEGLRKVMSEIARQESTIQKLTVSRCQFEKQLEGEIQKHQELIQQGLALKTELCELEEPLRLTIKHLKEEIAMVEGNIEVGQASKVSLVDYLSQIYEIHKNQQDEENEVRAEHILISQQLSRSKLQLEEGIASIVKHSKEIKEMDKQIKDLLEAVTINKRVFLSNQEELCNNMEIEKKNINHLVEERNRLKRLLEDAKEQEETHVANLTFDISNTKSRYEELRQEEATLHQCQPKSTDIKLLKKHMAQCEVEYRQIESKQSQEIEQFTEETEIITRNNEEKQRELEEKEEFLKGVEAKMTEEQSRHQNLTVLMSELRKRKSELALSIEQLKEKTNTLLQLKEEKKTELNALRTCHVDVLNKQATELKAVEISIYDNQVKQEQVNMENSRLHLCIRQLTEDISRVRQDKDRYWQEICKINEDLKALFDSLQKGWREDVLVTQEGQSRDGAVLVSISDLLNIVKTRREQIENVSTLLHLQKLDFSKRLGDKTVCQQN